MRPQPSYDTQAESLLQSKEYPGFTNLFGRRVNPTGLCRYLTKVRLSGAISRFLPSS